MVDVSIWDRIGNLIFGNCR
uniref:Uncharacterized protein n=1 Tax=Arundo donax TaxID=35708 RepID=A0A0A8ZSS6_ARUDO